MTDSSLKFPIQGGGVVTLETDLAGGVHTIKLAGLTGGTPPVEDIGSIVITWNTAATDNTPGFEVDLPLENGAPTDVEEGDTLAFEYTTNGGSSWTSYVDITITAGHISGDSLSFAGASSIADGEWDFRARLERSGHISPWATDDVTIDATAPEITSSDTLTINENAALNHALTADETVTWTITAGADQAEFDISGSTLTWSAPGTRDYEDPLDGGTNNIYEVTVRATDTAGNTTDQNITVEVLDLDDAGQRQFFARRAYVNATALNSRQWFSSFAGAMIVES
jgi:hypothetical protein